MKSAGFLRSRARSFRYAFEGWRYVMRTQHNAWIHATATVCVLALALALKLPGRDWAVLLLTIALVWTAELINTAIEAVVDLASPHFDQLAKVAKDVAASAVLVTAVAAIVVGLLILGPPLWQLSLLWLQK